MPLRLPIVELAANAGYSVPINCTLARIAGICTAGSSVRLGHTQNVAQGLTAAVNLFDTAAGSGLSDMPYQFDLGYPAQAGETFWNRGADTTILMFE